MNADLVSAVTERWLARTLESYPESARVAMRSQADPFRNPAGHALKESLGAMARELFGDMDRAALAAPLDAVVRLRAVQGFTPSQALGFIFELRPAAAEVPGAMTASLQPRIDELALMAFDKYMSCREQIFELRTKELRLRAQCAARAE
jgi:hypothetical protein